MKNNKAIIQRDEKEFKFIEIGNFEYKVAVFSLEKLEFSFTILLRPTGNDEELPVYYLYPEDQKVPKWLMNFMPQISEWAKEIKA